MSSPFESESGEFISKVIVSNGRSLAGKGINDRFCFKVIPFKSEAILEILHKTKPGHSPIMLKGSCYLCITPPGFNIQGVSEKSMA